MRVVRSERDRRPPFTAVANTPNHHDPKSHYGWLAEGNGTPRLPQIPA